MTWNGSGTFSRITTTVSPAVANTTIDVAGQNTYTADVTAGINACLAKNGENAATADLPMGGYNHTNVDDGTETSHYSSVGQAQNGSLVYAADTGAADVYVVTLAPAPASYTAGLAIRFLASATNTGASTINVNALGAKDIKTQALNDPEAGVIQLNGLYTLVYDGTQFQLQDIQHGIDVGFEATATSGSIATSWTQVVYATEGRDPGGNYASSYYTCPTDGIYQFNAQTTIASLDAGKLLAIALYVDGGGGDTLWATGDQLINNNVAAKLGIVRVTKSGFLSAGDKVSVYADTDEASAADCITSTGYNYFDGYRILFID